MDEIANVVAERRAQLQSRLARLRSRIERACERAGRDPAAITLIGVTKTFPLRDAELLADLGLRDLGENRDQEAREKAAALPHVRWHFLGQLQRNKCRSVAGYAHAVHSVDRLELVRALAHAADGRTRPLEVFLQINLDEAPGDPTRRRGGVDPKFAVELATEIAQHPHLVFRGVMGIAPPTGSADLAFSQLKRVSDLLRRTWSGADAISAGMSGDMEIAIAAGATHVRVGSALLGIR